MTKKKPVSTNFIVPFGTYPFDLMVSVGQDDDQLGRVLDRHPLTEEDILNCRFGSDTCQGRYAIFSTGGSFIRLRKLPESSFDYGVLGHEIFHVVAGFMLRIGMKLKVGTSDEAYAYLIGHLTEQVYNKLNKYY